MRFMDFSHLSSGTDGDSSANETALSDQFLATLNRDPDMQAHFSHNPFRRHPRGPLADKAADLLCRQLNLIAAEMGLPDDLPVPPRGLPGICGRRPDMDVMEIIRCAANYPFAMANGETRTLWNIHDEIASELNRAYRKGYEVAQRERDEAARVDADRRLVEPDAQRVYFIRCGAEGAIKIGIAVNPDSRLRALQTAHHEKLDLLAVRDGGLAQEQAYHRRFAAHRLHGEWFAPHPDILAEIARLAPHDGGN